MARNSLKKALSAVNEAMAACGCKHQDEAEDAEHMDDESACCENCARGLPCKEQEGDSLQNAMSAYPVGGIQFPQEAPDAEYADLDEVDDPFDYLGEMAERYRELEEAESGDHMDDDDVDTEHKGIIDCEDAVKAALDVIASIKL